MAEHHRDSNRTRNPAQADQLGRARQRQSQRTRASEQRRSLSQTVGLETSTDSRRSAPRRPAVAQQVEVPQRRPAERRTRPLLGDRRQRRDRSTSNSAQGRMPPVLVRGGMPDMAVRRTKRSLPKRRFDVALNVPGAELRLPSLPLIQPGWRAFSGILAVMMIACLFMMWKSPAFQVNSVEAEGLVRWTVGDLTTVMNIMGGSIFSIDPPAVEQTLSRLFPELAEISVKVSLPAHVLVQARERQPVLSWYQDEREVWVDADGVAFIPRGNPGSLVRVQGHGAAPAASAEVVIPAVGSLPTGALVLSETGKEADMEASPPARLPVDLVQAILTLGSQVPAETQLVFDAQHGLGWQDQSGWEVYFGHNTGEMAQKLLVYQGVSDYLTNQGLQPELVSVAYTHAPYYRMER